MNADVARLSIVFIGLALGTLEWFIIKRASFNKWVVPTVYCVGALIWAFAMEPAQVLFLSLVIAFIMAVYAIKDELINRRLQRRGTSGVDKTRLRDLWRGCGAYPRIGGASAVALAPHPFGLTIIPLAHKVFDRLRRVDASQA